MMSEQLLSSSTSQAPSTIGARGKYIANKVYGNVPFSTVDFPKIKNSNYESVILDNIHTLIGLAMRLGIPFDSNEYNFLLKNHLAVIIEESLRVIDNLFGDDAKVYLEVNDDDLFVIIKVTLEIDDAAERLGKLYSQWWTSKRSSVQKEILFDLEF